MEIFQKCGDRLDVYSGEDGLVVPMLSMGGMGCISVLSNVVPKESVEMCDKFFAGDVAGAAALQLKLLELVNCLFCEVNPIPVKAAISAMGFGEEFLRMPLTPMEPANRDRLLKEMRKLGVIQ
jgi:4-hydroxy-tetrahydrodipicolinate synthase